MRLFVPLLLLASLVPVAAANPFVCRGAFVAGGCAGEWDVGDCGTQGYRGDGVIAGALLAGAWVEGSEYCEADAAAERSYRDHGVFAGFGSIVAGVAIGWYEYHSTTNGVEDSRCVTFVDAYVLFFGEAVDVGCPAGAPPNPGWGTLLP